MKLNRTKLTIPLTAGLAAGAAIVAVRRRRRTMSAHERALLEVEFLAAIDEIDAERVLLNAEFARRL